MAASEKEVIERCLYVYAQYVDRLKDDIKTLYSSYHQLASEIYEREDGERLARSFQTFKRCLINAINRCDELEAQLLNFESWVDLPIVNRTDTSTNLDEVSGDAQHLLDFIQELQSVLLSAMSDPALKDTLQRLQLMEAPKCEDPQNPPQSPGSPMMTQNYQLLSEMAEVPPSLGSIPTPFISDNQSGLPFNDGLVPLGALNPTIPSPEHSFTPPNPQARQTYSDVPSPFIQQ
ncbi:hypothetical protein Aperf_G00000027215 [Anoplocephala perfoliata]